MKNETPIEGFIKALENLKEFAEIENLKDPIIQFSIRQRIEYLGKWVSRIESWNKEEQKFTYICDLKEN